MTPRLLTGLTLTILDVTFRMWSRNEKADIVAITEEIFESLTNLVGPSTRASRKAHR
jgi:hypothetical protein